MTKESDSKSKIALVTGSNKGIGLEIVKQLLDNGFITILTSRDPKKGQQVFESIQYAPGTLYHQQLDINDQASIDRLQEFVINTFGKLDILINNAGIFLKEDKTTLETPLSVVMETFETNLFGAWRMCKTFVPLMKKQHFGRIINVSSGLGALEGMTGSNPGYGISKTALNALTIKLADELKNTGILVNAVCPGWVKTDMGGKEAPRTVEKGAETIVWLAQLSDNGPTGRFFRDMRHISF